MKKNHNNFVAHDTVANPSHQLAMANLDLIDMVIYGSKVVKMCTFLNRDEFYQIGYEALYKAACRYNGARGAAFETFAYVCIENAFISAVRALESPVRLPHGCDEDLLLESLEQLMQKGKHVGATFMNRSRTMVSHLIQEADLDKRERHILCNKYDIMLDEEPLSTQDLAEYYHMTTQSVNRICRSAIEKLKKVAA
jgi:RNA polymerase sigma factor (sigma-70 family)